MTLKQLETMMKDPIDILIVEDSKVITVDEDQILSYARKQAERLWAKMR